MAFQIGMGCAHPSIRKLIHFLRKELSLSENKFLSLSENKLVK